jgi:hypothetical protein
MRGPLLAQPGGYTHSFVQKKPLKEVYYLAVRTRYQLNLKVHYKDPPFNRDHSNEECAQLKKGKIERLLRAIAAYCPDSSVQD